MKSIKFIPIFASAILLSSCSLRMILPTLTSTSSYSSITTDSSTTSSTTSIEPVGEKGEWTILIYLCGSNLESGYDAEYDEYEDTYFATSDLKEILSVNGQPNDVRIVIQTGGSKRWQTKASGGFGISNSKIERYHVENKKLIRDEQHPQASMGDQSTLESFLEYGLTNYPAEKTGIIFWNHGGGMFGVCNDENDGDEPLYNDEIQGAFENVFPKFGINKLEFVGYDACLMAVQDIAETNSKYFNYMVCSQESETGYGWDYDTWIDDLYAKKETHTILKAIVDGFITSVGGVDATGEWYEGDYYPSDQTLSYLDLSKMPAYKTAWENLASALKAKVESSGSSFRRNVMAKVKPFGGADYDYFSEYDINHFLTKLEESSFNLGGTYINDVRTQLSNLIAYNVSQKEAAHDACGLSLFFPSSLLYLASQKAVYTAEHTNLTNWMNFARSSGGNVSSTYNY